MPLKDKKKRRLYDNEWKKMKRKGMKGDEVRKYDREYMKEWRRKNPDKKCGKSYEERKEYYKAYFQKNKKRLAEQKQKYYQEHKEYFKEKSRKSYYKTKKKIQKRWQRKRMVVLKHYGCKCQCCGETQVEFLAIDHINNDGNIHRKQIKTNMIDWIIKNNFPDNFQVLCHNCNLSKAFYGYCPHQKKDKNYD